MCKDCGCMETGQAMIDGAPAEGHAHHHDHWEPIRRDAWEEGVYRDKLMRRNNHIAGHNQEHLDERSVFCVNLISAPGSGKTSLLERLIKRADGALEIAVVEGDPQTENDARRIRETGALAVQINTGAACHLDAEMVHRALHRLRLRKDALLFIENVGNLACPADFDLGEHMKIAVVSCTEGEDKPAKYADLLRVSEAMIINKIDLLPFLDFDMETCTRYALEINPNLRIFAVSARTGEGMEPFFSWLLERKAARVAI